MKNSFANSTKTFKYLKFFFSSQINEFPFKPKFYKNRVFFLKEKEDPKIQDKFK